MHKSLALAALTLLSATMVTATPAKMCAMDITKRVVPDCAASGKILCGDCNNECCDKNPDDDSPDDGEMCIMSIPNCKEDEKPCGKCKQQCCPKTPADDPIMCTMEMPICADTHTLCGKCMNQCCPKDPPPPDPEKCTKMFPVCAPNQTPCGKCNQQCCAAADPKKPCPHPAPAIKCAAPLVAGGHCNLQCVQPKEKACPHPAPMINCKAPLIPGGHCNLECVQPKSSKPAEPAPQKSKRNPHPDPMVCTSGPTTCPAPKRPCGICKDECCVPGYEETYVGPGFIRKLEKETAGDTPADPPPADSDEDKHTECCKDVPMVRCREGYQPCGFCGEICGKVDQPCPRVRPPPGYEMCMDGGPAGGS